MIFILAYLFGFVLLGVGIYLLIDGLRILIVRKFKKNKDSLSETHAYYKFDEDADHENNIEQTLKEVKEGSKCYYCNDNPIGYVMLLNSYEVYKLNKKTKRFSKTDSGVTECCDKIYFCKEHEKVAIDS